MEIKTFKLSDLKDNRVQPKGRVTKSAIAGLLNSVKRHGVISPLLVTETGIIIDGHRRKACLEILEQETVFCIIVNGELDTTDIKAFTVCNANTKKLNASDYLEVYMKGGDVPYGVLKAIMFVCEKMGRKYLKELVKRGLSPYYPQRVFSIAKRLGYDSPPEKLVEFISWSHDHKQFSNIMILDKSNDNNLIKRFVDCFESNTKFKL